MRRARYFSETEFRCRCQRPECEAPLEISGELLGLLDEMRADVGRPLHITSGFRCAYWNERSGGLPGSAHLDGTEADIACATSAFRYDLLASAYRHAAPRIGIGSTFIHVGVSATHPRGVVWTYYPATRAAALLADDPRVC